MLSKKIKDDLNIQITEENLSSHIYLAMASWSETQGLRGTAKFMYHHANEEHEHMMKFVHYVNDAGGHAAISGFKTPASTFKSLKDLIEMAYEHEQYITQRINHLVDLSLKLKDHATFNFLQWFVGEQHEEETLFHTVLDIVRLVGLDGRGLYLADKEIGKMIGKT